MSESDDETYCMTLRGIRGWTADVLYDLKSETGSSLSQLVDEIVAYYVEHHPSMQQQRLEAAELLAAEFGVEAGTA